jgi:hypothetical protein
LYFHVGFVWSVLARKQKSLLQAMSSGTKNSVFVSFLVALTFFPATLRYWAIEGISSPWLNSLRASDYTVFILGS